MFYVVFRHVIFGMSVPSDSFKRTCKVFLYPCSQYHTCRHILLGKWEQTWNEVEYKQAERIRVDYLIERVRNVPSLRPVFGGSLRPSARNESHRRLAEMKAIADWLRVHGACSFSPFSPSSTRVYRLFPNESWILGRGPWWRFIPPPSNVQVRQTRGRPTSVGRSTPQSAITQTRNRHLIGVLDTRLIPYVIRAFVYIRFGCLFVGQSCRTIRRSQISQGPDQTKVRWENYKWDKKIKFTFVPEYWFLRPRVFQNLPFGPWSRVLWFSCFPHVILVTSYITSWSYFLYLYVVVAPVCSGPQQTRSFPGILALAETSIIRSDAVRPTIFIVYCG